MAEFGAHLTTAPNNHNNVSIFEVLAQHSLESALRRAAQYVCRVLCESNPEKFAALYSRFDELYLLFDCCVQYCHLRAYNSSFAENFYSLKRVSAHSPSVGGGKLDARQLYSSLLLLTLSPYVRRKCDSLYERLRFAELERRITVDTHFAHILFLRAYPAIGSFWQLLSLVYQISYAVNRNRYHSPLVQLSGVVLRSLTEQDLRERSADIEILDPSLSWYRYLKRLSWLSSKWVANGLGAGLSIGAFFIQFLDYWYTRPNSPSSLASFPIPPPPQRQQIETGDDVCPICLKTRTNDTALSTSGFVFCYPCIRNFVLEYNRCPITGFPTNSEHLIKIYHRED